VAPVIQGTIENTYTSWNLNNSLTLVQHVSLFSGFNTVSSLLYTAIRRSNYMYQTRTNHCQLPYLFGKTC